MAIPLSNEIRALLDSPNFAHLATLMPDGSPLKTFAGLTRNETEFVTFLKAAEAEGKS
jgi:hypothetical protein